MEPLPIDTHSGGAYNRRPNISIKRGWNLETNSWPTWRFGSRSGAGHRLLAFGSHASLVQSGSGELPAVQRAELRSLPAARCRSSGRWRTADGLPESPPSSGAGAAVLQPTRRHTVRCSDAGTDLCTCSDVRTGSIGACYELGAHGARPQAPATVQLARATVLAGTKNGAGAGGTCSV